MLSPVGGDPLNLGVEPKVFFNRQQGEDRVFLGAVANQLAGLCEVGGHAVACNLDFASSWHDLSRQALEGGRFAGSVDAKQGEALAVVKAEGDVLNGKRRLSEQADVHFSEVVDSDHILARTVSGLRLLVEQGCGRMLRVSQLLV